MPTFSSVWLHFKTTPIEFSTDYNQATPMLFRPLELHLYLVIMGCTGVCISFLLVSIKTWIRTRNVTASVRTRFVLNKKNNQRIYLKIGNVKVMLMV